MIRKIDLSGKESGHAASQIPQEKSVKQDSKSQTDFDRAILQNNNASSPSPSGGAPLPSPPPVPNSNKTSLPKKANSPSDPNVKPNMSAAFNLIRQKPKPMNKEECDKKLKKQAAKKLGSNGDQQQQNLDGNLEKMLIKRAIAMALSCSSESGYSNQCTSSEGESCGPDSDAESRAMSLLEGLAAPPYFSVDSLSTVQVNNVDPVNSEIQDPSALSAKEHTKHLNSQRSIPVLSY